MSVCTLRETIVDGDRCLTVEDGTIRLSLNVDHGAHVFELTDMRSAENLLYQDPRGHRNYSVGGWYELFPNAGAACVVEGQHQSLNGDIQHRPWTAVVRAGLPGRVVLDLVTTSTEMPFRISRRLVFSGRGIVNVRESITNLSKREMPFLWGHHITFGAAMMGRDCGIDVPAAEFVADSTADPLLPYLPGARGTLHDLPGREGNTVDLTRFPEQSFSAMLFAEALPEHRYAVWSRNLGVKVSVTWDGSAFPALWYWATNAGRSSDPELRAFALEPQSSAVHTLSRAVGAHAAPMLPFGGRRSAWLRLALRNVDDGV